MKISNRISNTWKGDGLFGIALRSAVYCLRRVSWRTDAWSKELDQAATARVILKNVGDVLERNVHFKNIHKNQRCFVIGNGPSLKQQDLTPLAGDITFVTNYFHKHPVVSDQWQPTYYCLSDPAYFDGSEPAESFAETVALVPQSKFFVPHYAFDFLQRTKVLPLERTYYVASTGDISENTPIQIDLSSTTPGVQTVVQLAIMVAIYMGCSPIYLMGLDHDWLAHGGSHLNFYSNTDPNQPAGNLPGWGYHSMMDAVLMMWKVYELHARMAEAAGIKIINCTAGGFLDVFPRIPYEDVVGKDLQSLSSRIAN